MIQKRTKKRISNMGRRTGLDVRAGKRIRVDNYGMEQFDDYWTSSNESSEEEEGLFPKCSSPAISNAPRMSSFVHSQYSVKELLEKISFVKTPTSQGCVQKTGRPDSAAKLNMDKKKILAKGRRTGADILAGKKIQIINGIENFDNYWTDSSAATSLKSKVSSNRYSSRKYASLDSEAQETLRNGEESDEGHCFNEPPEVHSPQTLRYMSRAEDIKTPPQNKNGTFMKLPSFRTLEKSAHNLTRVIVSPRSLGSEESNNGLSLSKSLRSGCDTAKPKSKRGRKKKNEVVSSTSDQVNNNKADDGNAPRRSQRARFPPMQKWRFQRLHEKYDKNGNLLGVEVIEGKTPDNISVKTIEKNVLRAKKKKVQKQEKKLEENSMNLMKVKNDINKVEIVDPQTGQEQLVYLHRPHNTLLWTVPPQQDKIDASYTITKCFSGGLISFGFIEIGIGKKKKEQHSPDYNIAFNVIRGTNVTICIHKTSLCLKELDYVVVPAGNVYSMRNKGKCAALLSFSTFQAPMFDYQFPK